MKTIGMIGGLGFQRGNFWGEISSGSPNWHLNLGAPSVLPELTIEVHAGSGLALTAIPGNTGYSGCIGVAELLALQTPLTGFLGTQELSQLPLDSLPILLLYDVFIGTGSGNYWSAAGAGYHGSTPAVGGGSQTWAWTTYNGGLQDGGNKGNCFDIHNNPITCEFQDVADFAHEIGEWADDPFGHTPAPCQGGKSFLEVGDPLLGASHYEVYPGANNSYPYHLQDLVFLPYFGAATSTSYRGQTTFQDEAVSYCANQ